MAVAMSFGVPNYSGMLFNKGNTRTPFSTLIGARPLQTNHVEFACGQYYTGGGTGTQPSISESASLTAPTPTSATRTQMQNVTQIFQESLGVSYAKMSNMGTLSGINVAGQVSNPADELDFQVAVKMQKIARDIEYSFIRGQYNKATSDVTVNQTRGMVEAISTNDIDANGKALNLWTVAEAMKSIDEQNAPTQGLILLVDGVTMMQINADAVTNGMSNAPADRTVNGINIKTLVTPFGDIGVVKGEFLPAGTALVANIDVISPVFQPVPGKGNFFLEELSKVGAGTTYQIFGQAGLDHGPEWYHAKITNIASTFTAPTNGGASSTKV